MLRHRHPLLSGEKVVGLSGKWYGFWKSGTTFPRAGSRREHPLSGCRRVRREGSVKVPTYRRPRATPLFMGILAPCVKVKVHFHPPRRTPARVHYYAPERLCPLMKYFIRGYNYAKQSF